MENNTVRDFYNKWAYPNFNNFSLDDLLKLGAIDSSDPGKNWNTFWPNRPRGDKIKILVAGCGTIQASLLAAKNKNASVIGIDVSKNSLDIQRKNSKNLDNIELIESSILNFETKDKFDLIVCTGVLHHLKNPEECINHMSSMLSDNGIMTIMLYNKIGRHGVYLLQEVVKILDLENSIEGARKLAEIIDNLPTSHSVRKYIEQTQEVDYLENFMDTFFNPCDNPYSALDVQKLIEKTDLSFYKWLNMDYDTYNINIDDCFKKAHFIDLMYESNNIISFILTKPENLAIIKSVGNYNEENF
jgi:SAM-dependent methyltransferase